MEKVFRKTVKVMNVPLLKRFCEGGVFGWWETVAERVIQFSQPRPHVRRPCPSPTACARRYGQLMASPV